MFQLKFILKILVGISNAINIISTITYIHNNNYYAFICSDIDECASTSLNNCHPNATCTDTDGSYMCTCNVGSAGDGITCEGK